MKRLFRLISAVAAVCIMTATVSAREYISDNTWTATFDGNDLTDNFGTDATHEILEDMFNGMQPGDSAQITVNLQNTSKKIADFYMKNEVLNSLEKSSETSGGAYTYILTYYPSAGEPRELYNSDTVGGEEKNNEELEGMKEATDALKEYLFLESIPKDKGSKLVLRIDLDGESQANNYEETQADLYMAFAVEVPPTATPKPNEKVIYERQDRVIYLPNTGDDSNLPLYGGLFAVSILLALFAVYRLRKTSKEG